MKLPCRILGLIAAAAAASVGCASEPSEPAPNKTDQNIQADRSSDDEKPEKDPSEPQTPPSRSAGSSPAVPPDHVDAPRPAGELPPDEELPRQAEDAPLKGSSPAGGPASAPLEGEALPRGGSAMPGQDPCPACGMG